MGELSIIRDLRRRAGAMTRDISLGIGDDCALLRPRAGEEIAITTDFSLENVHFRRDWHPPQSVGHRCLARGLSDLAAMGARPLGALLSLALPPELTHSGRAGKGDRKKPSWQERFLDGFLNLAAAYKLPLIGGDTAQSASPTGSRTQASLCADVVLLGGVTTGDALRRSGSRPGDLIYVTGSLGGAAAELLALGRDPKPYLHLTRPHPVQHRRGSDSNTTSSHPHLYPQPRVAVGRKLISLATAAIDLSDGLSTDLRHICEESGLAAEIYDVPLHSLAIQAESDGLTLSALKLALDGGEDYELLFTAPLHTKIPSRIAGVPIHVIGEMKRRGRGRPLIQMRVDTRGARTKLVRVEPGGWSHFKNS